MKRMQLFLWIVIVLEGLAVYWLLRPWLTPDTAPYVNDAANLRHFRFGVWWPGRGYVPDGIRAPGYPLVLCFLMYVLHLPFAGAIFVQLCMFFGAVWLSERILGDDLRL